MRFRRFKEKHDTSLLNTSGSKASDGKDTPKSGEDEQEQTPKQKKTPVKKSSAKKESASKPSAKKRKLSEAPVDSAAESPVKDEPQEDEDVGLPSMLCFCECY